MKKNKYTYLFVIQGRLERWEDLTQTESYREAVSLIKDYRKNSTEAKYFRIVKRRILNTEE